MDLRRMIVTDFPYAEWQIPYRDALTEIDKQRMRDKVLFAEWKICERLQAISALRDHHEERSALADAVDRLRVLEIETLNYPKWSKSA
jgi:hypothetical protein